MPLMLPIVKISNIKGIFIIVDQSSLKELKGN